MSFEKEFVAPAMAAAAREAHEIDNGGALEGRWQQIFHRFVNMCLASMNLG